MEKRIIFTGITVDEIAEVLLQHILPVLNQTKKEVKDEDELLTIEQVADFLKLKVSTIYGYTQRAEIPFFKRGKRLYFSKLSLYEWIKNGRKKTLKEISIEAERYIELQKERA